MQRPFQLLTAKHLYTHSYRRVSATIASYMGALEALGIDVDTSVETEMLGTYRPTDERSPVLVPTPWSSNRQTLSGIQRAHKMELMRLGNSLAAGSR